MSYKTLITYTGALLLPAIAIAADEAGDSNPTTFKTFVGKIIDQINLLIPFVVGLTVFMLIIGIFRYSSQGASEEGRQKGKELMIYGVIGVFIMLSFWGLAVILHNTIFGSTL